MTLWHMISGTASASKKKKKYLPRLSGGGYHIYVFKICFDAKTKYLPGGR